jgi:hypothetical protein
MSSTTWPKARVLTRKEEFLWADETEYWAVDISVHAQTVKETRAMRR